VADPPDDLKMKFVGALPNPATLPLLKRLAVLPEMTLFIVGVPIKCALSANTVDRDTVADIMTNARSAVDTIVNICQVLIIMIMIIQKEKRKL
jgi:hypothetical protein